MVLDLNAKSQVCIARTDTCLRNGVYILYNRKNCLPCYIKLKEYFSEVKDKKKTIRFYGIALIDSTENEKSVRNHLERTIFNYCDTIVINYAVKTVDYYDQQPAGSSLFSVYKIKTTPAIIVVADKIFVFYSKDIFNENSEVSQAIKKITGQ